MALASRLHDQSVPYEVCREPVPSAGAEPAARQTQQGCPGLYTGFFQGGKLGICQKEGGGAVHSCRAAAGGLGIQGGRE